MSPHISKLNRHQLVNSAEKVALPRDKSPTRDFIKKHPDAMVKLYQTQHPKVFPPADKVRLFKDKVRLVEEVAANKIEGGYDR